MCISLKHILVHLGCHSITKTKQGPFTLSINDGILTIHMTLHTKLFESIAYANPLCVHKISKLPQVVYQST